MKWFTPSLWVVVMGFTVNTAGASTAYWQIDGRNPIPGTIANALFADGLGTDWTGAVLKIDLSSGSIYNDPAFDSDAIQPALWGFIPLVQWDSWVGVNGDGTGGIAGGAGDLGGGPGTNLGGTGPGAANITWFNTATNDTGPVQIANITMTEDAAGTWELIVSFADSQVRSSGVFEYGDITIPEPASLALTGLAGFALLRRRG